VAQEIATFDASATPASIALVVDASPSIYRELAEMREAAHALAENLSPADEIAVVSFSSDAHLLMPFSTSRSLLDRAIDSKYLARVENSSESKIYQSVFLHGARIVLGPHGKKSHRLAHRRTRQRPGPHLGSVERGASIRRRRVAPGV
jgi:hypothetical protein